MSIGLTALKLTSGSAMRYSHLVLFASTFIAKFSLLLVASRLELPCALWHLTWHWPSLFAVDAVATGLAILCVHVVVPERWTNPAMYMASAYIVLHTVALKVFHVVVDFEILLFIATHASIFLKNLPFASGQWSIIAVLLLVMLPPCIFAFRCVGSAFMRAWHGMQTATQRFCPRLGDSSARLLPVLVALEVATMLALGVMVLLPVILHCIRVWSCWWHSLVAVGITHACRSCGAAAARTAVLGLLFCTLANFTRNKCWLQACVAAFCYQGLLVWCGSTSLRAAEQERSRRRQESAAAAAALPQFEQQSTLSSAGPTGNAAIALQRAGLRHQLLRLKAVVVPPLLRHVLLAAILTTVLQWVLGDLLNNSRCQLRGHTEMQAEVDAVGHWRANPLLRLSEGVLDWAMRTLAHALGTGGGRRLDLEVLIGPPKTRLNVVMIMLESVRASSIPLAAPFLSSWSRHDSHVRAMRHAQCTTPNTMKSMFAIHCGVPAALGVAQREYFAPRLLRGCLPAALSRHGYRTAYFTSGGVGYQGRLGFNETYTGEEAEVLGRSALSNSTLREFERSHYLGLEEHVMLPAFDAWLGGQERYHGPPFFATLGTVSTHAPYTIPRRLSKKQKWSDKYNFCRTCQRSRGDSVEWHQPADCVFNCFRRSLNYVDNFIRDLIELLKRRDLLQNTVVVVVGDHGEHFEVDGVSDFMHGSTVDEHQTHVPLFVRTPASSTSTNSVHDQDRLRAQESAVVSLTSVPRIVADALGSTIGHRVHEGSDEHASLILGSQHDNSAVMVANLYGTKIGEVHQARSNSGDERCVLSTEYARFFSGRCTLASKLRLEQYARAVRELYANVVDGGGCNAGVLKC